MKHHRNDFRDEDRHNKDHRRRDNRYSARDYDQNRTRSDRFEGSDSHNRRSDSRISHPYEENRDPYAYSYGNTERARRSDERSGYSSHADQHQPRSFDQSYDRSDRGSYQSPRLYEDLRGSSSMRESTEMGRSYNYPYESQISYGQSSLMQPYRSPMSYTSETPRRESDVRRANMHEAEGPLESAWESIKSFFGKGPKGYKRSDERIREDVSEALYKDHHVDASDIEVSVSNGEVTLTGTVTDRRMKRIAEDCVESVSGVEDVRNELRVQSSMTSSASTTSTSATDTTAATSAASMSGRTSDRTDRTKARSTPDQLM